MSDCVRAASLLVLAFFSLLQCHKPNRDGYSFLVDTVSLSFALTMSYRSALYRTTSSLRLGNRVRRLTVSQPPRISSKLHFDTQYGSLALAASILAGACLYQNYETTKTAPLMVAPHLGSFAASVLEPEDRFQPIATTFTKPLEQPYDVR